MQQLVRVVHIVCKGRSGSTLLDRLLGDGCSTFSAGELDRFWLSAGSGHIEMCACGSTLETCPVWSAVARRPEVAAALGRRCSARSRPPRPRRTDAIALYRAISAVTGVSTVIDSSKSLKALARVANHPHVCVSAVHLVRDPRAVAFSWSRPRPLADRPGAFMQRRGIVDSAMTWIAKNAAIEALLPLTVGRTVRVRYEDLAVDPTATIEHVRSALDIPPPAVFGGRHNHQIAGNPSRFEARPTIRLDTRWAAESSPWMRLGVAAITWPLAIVYGYR